MQQILNDPESMSQIFAMAQSMGGSMAEEQAVPSMPIDPKMMQALFGMMQQLQQTDSRQDALLCALKPYLAPARREKIDRAIQIARLSRLAGTAMSQFGLTGK